MTIWCKCTYWFNVCQIRLRSLGLIAFSFSNLFQCFKNSFYILLKSCIFKYLHFLIFQFSKLCIGERVKYMYLIPFLHCFEIEMYDWSNQPFGIVFIDHQKNKMWICNKIKTMNPIIWVFQKWFWPPLFIQRDGWIFHFFIIFLSIVARSSQSLGLWSLCINETLSLFDSNSVRLHLDHF